MAAILEGIRIIDAGTVLAAPGSSTFLADFGAEVIKVEMPITGDPIRRYPPHIKGQQLGSKVTNRNKFSVTLDLHQAPGREVFRKLISKADAVVLNYRLPTLKKWGLDYADLIKVQPRLIMLHITGYGRTGPYANWPGFARIAEAFSGLTYMSGYPDKGPMFPGYAIGDGIGGIYGALSLMLALYELKKSGTGQLIDLALYEPIMRILDDLYISHDVTGEIRERVGSINHVVSPSDIYRTKEGQWVVLPVSTPTMFRRLAEVIGHSELLDDERFRTNSDRVRHRDELDQYIRPYLSEHTLDEILTEFRMHEIAVGPVNNVKQTMDDVHIHERGSIESVWDPNLERYVRMQSVFPKLSKTPGAIRHPGPETGQDNDHIFRDLLQMSDTELVKLREGRVI
ncbi:MAG: CoA transferase [Firmicutes bacterium]|nr:CoA transferase [Bacillota bacterium]